MSLHPGTASYNPAGNSDFTRKAEALALADRIVDELSGGQRQRVGIARALMGEPDLLLADEPTASLDADRSQEIVTLLRQLTEDRGIACGFVTHDRSLITARDEVFELGGNA